MGRLIVDAATSLDGFWADARGRTLFSSGNPVGADLSACGAVVMSARAFQLVSDAEWIAGADAAAVAVFVVADRPARAQSEGRAVRFTESYATAFKAARDVAGERAVLVMGESGAMRAALRDGKAEDVWLHVLSRTLGQGAPLFDDEVPVDNYFVSEMETTAEGVHMHLERRLDA